MAVKIRLARIGKKGDPSYRIVAIHSTNKRNGKVLEVLGTYDPMSDPAKIEVKKDRVAAWIKEGAKPSEMVGKLLHL